jgi:putative sigma-54 modulation protein
MQLKIKTEHLNLSDEQKGSVELKVTKLVHLADRLDDESTEFKVELKHEKTRQSNDAYVSQITIFAPHTVIRSESRKDTLDNAVDDSIEKLKRQIERYKSKMHRSDKGSESAKNMEPVETSEEFEIPNILRRKRFSNSNPMSEEAAIEHMELIGHDFLLFNNSDTGRFSVVYKRHDGYYGIVEPKLETD